MKPLDGLVEKMAGFGEGPALLVSQKDAIAKWSFSDITQRVRCLSTSLRNAGLGDGKRALLLAANSPEWIVSCLGLFHAGAVPVPVDVQMSDAELRHVLDDSGAKWVFTYSEMADRLADMGSDLRFVLLDAEEEDHRSWHRFVARDACEAPEVLPEQTAAVFYTSGTSGKPKGVPLSHANLCSNVRAVCDLGLIQSGDRLLLPLPLHHIYPFTVGLLVPLTSGVPVIMPSVLTGPELFGALRSCGATTMLGVPRLYAALDAAIWSRLRERGPLVYAAFRTAMALAVFMERRLRLPVGRPLFAPLRKKVAPTLRFVASGGAALEPDLAWRLQAMGWQVAGGYGLTETSPVVSFNLPGCGLGTAGKPLAGVDVRISKAEGGSKQGEVLVKGPNVFSGYLNLPEENESSFTKDGYFQTGDLGYFDPQGFLHLVGRSSSMIVLASGENIQPEEIEKVLEQSDLTKEAGVLEREGRLVALLVPQAPNVNTQEETKNQVVKQAERLARFLPSHHRPSRYALSPDPIPRTRLGKIRRQELEKLYDEAQQGGAARMKAGPVRMEELAPEDRQLLDHPGARRIWEWLPQRFPDTRLSPDTSLKSDLGFDSLEWVAFSAEIQERTGTHLDGTAIGRIESVRDLLQEAAEAANGAGEKGDLAQVLRQPEQLLGDDQLKWLHPAKPWARLFGRMLLAVNSFFMRWYFQIEVRGVENLPRKGPLVIISNHVSRLDSSAIAAAMPRALWEQTYWGGWTGIMFKNRFMRAVSRATRVFPVDPERDPLAGLALGAAVLKAGNILVWYPEGAVSETGELQEFRPGIGFLLLAQPVPCVLVWLEGTQKALPPGRGWPRFARIHVRISGPLDPKQLELQGDHEQPEQRVARVLHHHVKMLSEKL